MFRLMRNTFIDMQIAWNHMQIAIINKQIIRLMRSKR